MPVNTTTETPSAFDDMNWTDSIYAKESDAFKRAVRSMINKVDFNLSQCVRYAEAVKRMANYTLENVQRNEMVLQSVTQVATELENCVNERKQLWLQFVALLDLATTGAINHKDLVLHQIGEHAARRTVQA